MPLHDPRVGRVTNASGSATIQEVAQTRKKLLQHLSQSGNTSEIVYYSEFMFVGNYSLGRNTPTDSFHGNETTHRVAFWDGHVSTVTQDKKSLRFKTIFAKPSNDKLRHIQGGEDWTLYADPRP